MPDEVSIFGRRSLTELFPSLRLVGAIRAAFDLRKIIIAIVGLVLLQGGWWVLDRAIPAADDTTPDVFEPGLAAKALSEPDFWSSETVLRFHVRLSQPVRLLAAPLFSFVEPGARWVRMFHAIASVIWLIAVWGICGGAISRIAVVRAAAARQTGIIGALRFALTHAHPLIVAPLCPLGVVVFLSLFNAAYGLLYRVPSIGPALAGMGLLFPLAIGLVMTLFIAALTAGWPLLQAATAGGAEDALDALSRIFGYLNQRLGSYVGLLALAWLGGLLGLALIELLTSGLIRLTYWSLSLTAPIAATESFFGSPPTSASMASMAGAMHGFWLAMVRLIAHGWVFSFFWTAAAYVYLWLRLDVDGMPWTEI